jgi:hypothetical protein
MGGADDEREWGRGAVFLVRLCKVCIHIFAVMNDEGIRETPTGPYFPTEDEKPKIIRIRGGREVGPDEWLPRDGERPRVCPRCKSPNWDRPKLWTGKRPTKAD